MCTFELKSFIQLCSYRCHKSCPFLFREYAQCTLHIKQDVHICMIKDCRNQKYHWLHLPVNFRSLPWDESIKSRCIRRKGISSYFAERRDPFQREHISFPINLKVPNKICCSKTINTIWVEGSKVHNEVMRTKTLLGQTVLQLHLLLWKKLQAYKKIFIKSQYHKSNS